MLDEVRAISTTRPRCATAAALASAPPEVARVVREALAADDIAVTQIVAWAQRKGLTLTVRSLGRHRPWSRDYCRECAPWITSSPSSD